ncbi:MAG: hypothetical protein WBM17_08965, partial [Anaerolineales bacterium]
MVPAISFQVGTMGTIGRPCPWVVTCATRKSFRYGGSWRLSSVCHFSFLSGGMIDLLLIPLPRPSPFSQY